ncbi:NAD-binding protein, partial [Candidatus Sumerlaeota bacterium]|nr:NAD-binding protein [Candidatus Sumerlaeota bacterium]
IPKGNHVLLPGDKVTLIGLPSQMGEAQELFHAPSEPLRHVTIAGGGNSGRFLAETLENRNFEVKLIEPDPERCEYLSERLRRTTILQGDATRIGFMKEERIGASDVFIAVTGDDEGNLMSCLLAKELGVRQTVARIHRPDYASLVQKMGVDLALSPRHIVTDRIMGMVMGGRIKSVSVMEEGKVEVIEFQAARDTEAVSPPLSEIDVPDGTLFGAIVHHGRVIVPHGDNVIHPGDAVIVVGLREKMDDVEKMFHGA